jgi:2-keto-3-deoxy-L-rhamnonate aldolase RhmA
MFATDFKTKLSQGRRALGIMMTFDFWPGYLEVFQKIGLDFVLIDCEHGAATTREVEELCRTARLCGLTAILRPEAADFPLIRKYADLGPAGFLIPWVETQEQLDTVRDAIFQPPRGRRGWGGPVLQAASGIDRAAIDEYERSLTVIAQIETPLGVERCQKIAACEWVDALMMGPYDLSVNLGTVPEMNTEKQIAATRRVIQACRQVGKPCGTVAAEPDIVRFWFQEGMQFVLCGEVSFVLQAALKSAIEAIRGPGREGGTQIV